MIVVRFLPCNQDQLLRVSELQSCPRIPFWIWFDFFFSIANIFFTHYYATMTWRSNKALTHVGLDKVKKDQKWNFIFFKKSSVCMQAKDCRTIMRKAFSGFGFFFFSFSAFTSKMKLSSFQLARLCWNFPLDTLNNS